VPFTSQWIINGGPGEDKKTKIEETIGGYVMGNVSQVDAQLINHNSATCRK